MVLHRDQWWIHDSCVLWNGSNHRRVALTALKEIDAHRTNRTLFATRFACLAQCLAVLSEQLVGFDQELTITAGVIGISLSNRFVSARVVLLFFAEADSQ